MANLQPTASFDEVYQLEKTDRAVAGQGGILNRQAQALTNRTEYLQQEKATRAELAYQVQAERERAIAEENDIRSQIGVGAGGKYGFNDLAAFELAKANIPVNSVVTIATGEQQGDNIWDGTNLTLSPFDPTLQLTTFVEANPLFKPKPVPTGVDIGTLEDGYHIITSDSVAATLTGLPPALTAPRRGWLFVIKYGTTNYQRFVRDFSTRLEAYERTGNGKSSNDSAFAWNTWKVANVEAAIENFRLSNDTVTPKVLTANSDLDTLGYGVYLLSNTDTAATVTNLPRDLTSPKLGIIFSYPLSTGVKYQRFVRYTETEGDVETYERLSNGGSSNNQWLAWRKTIASRDIKGFASVNLFPYVHFEDKNATFYQATTSVEDGFTVLNLNQGLTYAMYDIDISNSRYIKVGDVLTFTSDILTDRAGSNVGGDISIEFYAGASSTSKLGSTFTDANEVTGAWQPLTVTATIPEGTNRLRLRFINRGGTNTYCKFRKPKLTSSSWYATNLSLSGSSNSVSSVGTLNLFVAKSGSEVNSGTYTSPYASIQQAVNAIGDSNGTITILDSEWYRETVNISSKGNITLQSARNHRAKVVGSNQLVLTKTSGFTKVYQAPLADKPTGMGGARGKPMIAEWGTPSSLVEARDIHHLQRGERFRLPYTAMFEVASKEAVEAQNGVWYWENGIIYLSATDGSDATQKQYEARVRQTINHSSGSLTLLRMDILFSASYGFVSSGISVHREDCRVYGSYHNGFADNANATVSYRDMSLNNGNDGFNGTVTSYSTENLTTAVQANYFDPYGALNGDDGISFHIRGTCNIYGGLFEYNTKAGVVHVTGGGGNCYNTIARGQNFGFYTATATPDGRNLSTMHCHNTISERNGQNYCGGSEGSELYCFGTMSIEPITAGYSNLGGKVVARNCKYSGDAAKAKSGDVTVINDNQLV